MDTETVAPPETPNTTKTGVGGIDPSNPSAVVRIPISDLTLLEAADQVDDPAFFKNTRIDILFHFPQVGVDDYWNLTVGDHFAMVQFLERKGLLNGDHP